MTDLENAYRRLLRLYPPAYRRRREAEMLVVLVDSSAPGQARPARGDVADLLLGAVRAWWRWVVVPDPGAARTAFGLAAITLPMLHLTVAAAMFSRLPIAYAGPEPWAQRAQNFAHFHWSWPAWCLLVVAAGAVVIGTPRVARSASIAAAVLFVVLGPRNFPNYNHDTVMREMSWAVSAAVQAVLLASARVSRGRALLRKWTVLGAFVVAVTLGVALTAWQFRDPYGSMGLLDSTGDVYSVGILFSVAALTTRIGRVLAPLTGAGFAVLARSRDWDFAYAPGEIAEVLISAVAVFLVLRLLASVAEVVSSEVRGDSDRAG